MCAFAAPLLFIALSKGATKLFLLKAAFIFISVSWGITKIVIRCAKLAVKAPFSSNYLTCITHFQKILCLVSESPDSPRKGGRT